MIRESFHLMGKFPGPKANNGPQMPLLEICADDASGVRAALEGGADRVELCTALELGGLTPSPGLVRFAVELGIPVRVLIRPRTGSFIFNADEERVMREDITRTLALGAEGAVLGASEADGRLSLGMLERLIATAHAAGARGLTLHRAVDLAPDLEQAVDEAVALGFDTVLSSGGAPNALEGATMLARMRQRAPASVTIMAGAGVTTSNVGLLVAASGVRAVHTSARYHLRASDPRHAAFGFSQAMERHTSAGAVRAVRKALDDAA